MRQVRQADEVWSNTWENSGRDGGEMVLRPFQMVDLEFTPERATEPIHVLDRVDMNSVAGLREGSIVPIQYSAVDADSARIVGASRNYAWQAIIYLFCLVHGTGVLIAFVFIPMARGVRKHFLSSPVFRAIHGIRPDTTTKNARINGY